MSKAILISIQPKWCELIASGKKTVEIRKTKPKLETPFRCYIYQTQGHYDDLSISNTLQMWDKRQKVIGEFVCDEIRTEWEVADGLVDIVLEMQSCVDCKELIQYADGKKLYSWNISNLVIYDKPKELSEFIKPCIYGDDGEGEVSCFECEKSAYTPDIHIDCFNILTRPPQSWCYVEEIHNAD